MDYAKELTVERKVSAETFTSMAKHFTEREVCEIVYLVATEHVYNLTNIGLNIHSDMLCDITKSRKNFIEPYIMKKDSRAKKIAYWIITSLLCFELLYGALWDFNILNKEYVYQILLHLQYPVYLATILAVCKLIACAIIISNGLKLPKEWAYTGTFILFTGALISHICSGDTISQAVFAFALAIITVVSYLLRPQNRKLPAAS